VDNKLTNYCLLQSALPSYTRSSREISQTSPTCEHVPAQWVM